ncbi:sigma 54-interacting transcriptional regulator [Listeria sp. ILCC792]|uniref:sigma 54-interacting transcriptional regulator n=1 Tax=Listeria sp. ILCC792 TaxID=1918331 RepID=UPI000B58F4B8|nr:sigma 54-interacting transcriptional regulator [Listeria sp. ILCC792]
MTANLLEYLASLTAKLSKENSHLFTASAISESTGFSRSTVSRYLNEGVKEGVVLKIRERPVLFVDKMSFSNHFFTPTQIIFDSVEELLNPEKKDALAKIIGANASLKEQIEQIKTASLYPNNGLPIMLAGPSGSGKTFLARQIYEYCLEEGLLPKKAPFVSLNCAQYYHNPELLSSLLFGHVEGAFTGADYDKEGLLAHANEGVLFLDEVHRLTEEGQEKLFTFMDQGLYSPIGSSNVEKKATVRLIFATTETIHSTFLPTFVRRLPVIVNIPGFGERTWQEKLHLIHHFFMEESKILKHTIEVSSQVMGYLLSSQFEGNVGRLRNIIKYAAGNGYTKLERSEVIQVNIQVLPADAQTNFQTTFPRKNIEKQIYDYTKPFSYPKADRLLKSIQMVYEDFVLQFDKETDFYIVEMTKNVNLLLDKLYFESNLDTDQASFSSLTYHLRSIFKYMEENYRFEQDGNKILSMAYLLYHKESRAFLANHPFWNSQRNRILQFLQENLNEAFWLAKQVLTLLGERMDQKILTEDIVFISFYFHGTHIQSLSSNMRAVILAHGYSTASSMANIVNRILQKNIFQAIDMPIDTTITDIETRLLEYLNTEISTTNGLILLVDMGSLSEFAKRLENKSRGPILLMDYVSTPIALEVGQDLIAGKPIDKVGESIHQKKLNRELLFPSVKKKKAILTCCYTGMGSAIQIQEILQKSLQNTPSKLEIIPYDYKKLSQNKKEELPFQLYDVLAIVGTENPGILSVPYIGLNKLISGTHITEFIRLLKQHFELDEEELRKDLIFNFSLKKIIQNMTVLDAEKVLQNVERSVEFMEAKLDIILDNNKKFLLYVHMCCMIERILRKEKVDEQTDIEAFLEKNEKMIQVIGLAISNLEKEYHIEIPLLEIRLIADIVNTI